MNVATPEGLRKALAEVDATVGLQRVKVIHANDSRSPLGSHRDWHEHIGRGGIGREGFRRIVNEPSLRDKVFILETPVDRAGDDRRNLRLLQSLRSSGNGAARRRSEVRTVRGREPAARPQRGSTPERIRRAAGAR
jgi:endonuclease IV